MDVIHRDIKTANIFMNKNVPKIADFGFATHNKTK
jgi:serine/threonine protein kinase